MSSKNQEEKEKEKERRLSDLLKKVVTTGIGAAFMTEDAIKGVLSEIPLPKDILNGLLQNAKQTKEEFVGTVKTEIKKYLSNIDVSREIDRVLERYDIEVKATINLKRKKGSPDLEDE